MNRLLPATVLLVLAGCSAEKGNPPVIQKQTAPNRPAIDSDLPARIETATFAVG